MPAPVILAHSDPEFLAEAQRVLEECGFGVAVFTDPTDALDAIEVDGRCRVLVSRIEFGPGRQTGASLVRMVKNKKPAVRAVLIGPEGHRCYAIEDVPYLAEPVRLSDLVSEVQRLQE